MIGFSGRAFMASENFDPYYDSVIAILSFEDLNDTTFFVDRSGRSMWTLENDALVTGSDYKFGEESLYLPQTAIYDNLRTDSDFFYTEDEVGTPFTIEMWAKVLDYNAGGSWGQVLFSQAYNGGNGEQLFMINPSGHLAFVRHIHFDDPISFSSSTITIPENVWTHVAVSYDGTTVRLFTNGVLGASMENSYGWTYTDQPVRIGLSLVPNYSSYRGGLFGYIDEVRVTKACRYTSNFTPTGPFPLGANPIYSPLVNQPFGDGCALWLGMNGSNAYINKITGTTLNNINSVTTTAPTYDFPGEIYLPVYSNTNRAGAYIQTQTYLTGESDFAFTFYVRNPSIESQYNSEVVLGNVNKLNGEGFLQVAYEKDTVTFEIGSTTYGVITYTQADLTSLTDWLQVVLNYDATTHTMTSVVNGITKTMVMGPWAGSNYPIGIFNTSWNTGTYTMSLSGYLADFRYYNRQLTEEEVALYIE